MSENPVQNLADKATALVEAIARETESGLMTREVLRATDELRLALYRVRSLAPGEDPFATFTEWDQGHER